MKDPIFYTKRGLNTKYAFRCGATESKNGLTIHMEHGVYHVRGFRVGKMVDDTEEHELNEPGSLYKSKTCTYHIMGSFSHVKEARKFMSHPFTHKPSRDGSISVRKVEVG